MAGAIDAMAGCSVAQSAKSADLLVRTISAIVMLAIAGTALWMGGVVFDVFVALIAFLVVLEWRGLVVGFPGSEFSKGSWMAFGGVYIAFSCAAVMLLHDVGIILPLLAAVIGTDIGAYFSGRLIGGPKIAPAISPSKTWAGLAGGMVGSTLLLGLTLHFLPHEAGDIQRRPVLIVLTGALLAVVAQAGDFFESWLKRRAGVKDSGMMIPGHGGMFDRVDGLLAAAPVFYLWMRVLLR